MSRHYNFLFISKFNYTVLIYIPCNKYSNAYNIMTIQYNEVHIQNKAQKVNNLKIKVTLQRIAISVCQITSVKFKTTCFKKQRPFQTNSFTRYLKQQRNESFTF